MGLSIINDAVGIKEIYLSDDRKSAQVVTGERYAVSEVLPATESAPLQRTDTFRWDKGWLWFPAADDYWGERIKQSTASKQLLFEFPDRDRELVSR